MSAALAQLSRAIDRGVIGRYEKAEFFAVYSLGALALPFVGEIAESVMTVLIPELARLYKEGDRAQFVKIWQESIRKTSIFVLGTLGFVMFFAAPVMVALYGAQYADSALYFRLYQVALLLRVTLYGHILQAIGQTRQIMYTTVFLLVTKIGTNLTLYKMMGPTGPPVGSLVLAFIVSAYLLYFIARQLGSSMGRIWPWGYYFKILAAGVLAGGFSAVALLVSDNTLSAYVGRVSKALVRADVFAAMKVVLGLALFLPAYAALLHVFRALKDKDWRLLKSMTYGRFVRK